jgi:uncharacterized protein involved in exopolysaccharide biosynthesis
VLRRRWWLLALLGGAVLAVILVTGRLQPVRYEATVRFLVNVPPSADVTLYPAFDRPSANQQIATTQAAFMEVLRSPMVLERTRQQLSLDISMTELEQAVYVEKPLDSEFVWVTVSARDGVEAASIANALVATAREYYGELQAAPAVAALEFISAQVQTAQAQRQAALQALEAFETKNEVNDLEAEIDVARTVLWNLVLAYSQSIARGEQGESRKYEVLIEQRQADLARLTALSQENRTLQSEIDRAQRNYQFLLDKETEAKLKESEIRRASFIQVVSEAQAPQRPVSPYDLRIVVLGLAVSLVVGTVLAFVLEYLETHKRSLAAPAAVKPAQSQASD